MPQQDLHIVTGAFGYSGKYITQLLLDSGQRVRTLTGHANRENPFGERVEVAPYNFDNPTVLVESLRGAATLYNTYWIRFARGAMTFDQAVANTRILIEAAVKAGVQRFVHISITNPSEDSPLPYFRGKAVIERYIKESGLSYAILRPAVLFGREGILINNIAWMLRRMPVFGIPGDGNYRLQPVFISDLAALAVALGEKRESTLIDAVGPEAFTLNELVQLIRACVGSRTRIIHLPPSLALIVTGLLGKLMSDVILTREEVIGLIDNLLVSHNQSTCKTMLSDWLRENAAGIGKDYQSEVKRHYR